MRLNFIRLKNIRSYEDQKFEFPLGNILFKGDIGAGKSSVLFAVEFGFFGFINNITGDMLLRKGTNEGEVELGFEHNSKSIVIQRILKRKGNRIVQENPVIFVDGAKREMSAKELKALVFKMFRYPLSLLNSKNMLLYRYTVYTPQEDMKSILTSKPEERLKTIRKIFDIERYETIRSNIKSYVRELNYRIKERNAKIEELPNIKKEFSELTISLQEKQLELKKAKLNLIDLKNDLDKKKKEIDEVNEKIKQVLEVKVKYNESIKLKERIEKSKEDSNNKIEQLIQKKAGLETQIQEVKKKIDELDDLKKELQDKFNVKYEELNKIILEKYDFVSNQKERRNLYKSKLEMLEKAISDASTSKEKLLAKEKRLTEIDKEMNEIAVEDIDSKLNSLENELIELNKEIEKNRTMIEQKVKNAKKIDSMDICPVCYQKVDDSHKEKVRIETKEFISKINSVIVSLNEKLKEKNKEKELILVKRKENEEKKSKLQVLKKERETLENDIVELKQKLKSFDEIQKEKEKYEKLLKAMSSIDLDKINAEIEELKKYDDKLRQYLSLVSDYNLKRDSLTDLLKDLDKEKSKLREFDEELNQLNAKIAELKKGMDYSFSDELDKLKSEYDKINDLFLSKSKQISALETEINSMTDRKNELMSKIEQMEKAMNEKNKLIHFKNILLDFIVPLTENIEEHVRATIFSEFDEYYQIWFSKLMDNETMSTRLDIDFSPVVEQNGYEINYDYLSGGERTACALAYRLALNKVISDFFHISQSFIILDEPTDGFSYEQLDKMKDVLDELLFSQIILVSHESKVESFVQSVIEIEKSNNVSRIISR